MKREKPRSGLRLSAFDIVIIGLALAAGLALVFYFTSVKTPDSGLTTVRYTIQLQRWHKEDIDAIEVGDRLEDGIKNYSIGTVVGVEAVPATNLILNQVTHKYDLVELPNLLDALVTVEAKAQVTDRALIIDGGYEIRVGKTVYCRGEGYTSIGPAISVERLPEQEVQQ